MLITLMIIGPVAATTMEVTSYCTALLAANGRASLLPHNRVENDRTREIQGRGDAPPQIAPFPGDPGWAGGSGLGLIHGSPESLSQTAT